MGIRYRYFIFNSVESHAPHQKLSLWTYKGVLYGRTRHRKYHHVSFSCNFFSQSTHLVLVDARLLPWRQQCVNLVELRTAHGQVLGCYLFTDLRRTVSDIALARTFENEPEPLYKCANCHARHALERLEFLETTSNDQLLIRTMLVCTASITFQLKWPTMVLPWRYYQSFTKSLHSAMVIFPGI